MIPRPRVALMIETSTVYGRKLLQGITRYLRSHRDWSVYLEQREVDTVPPAWLANWQGDGVLSRWSDPRVAESLIRPGLAAVDLSDRRPPFGLPRINSDDRAIGRLAAEHLVERGFRSFACCGFSGELWAVRRKEAFLAALAQAGHAGSVYETPWLGAGAHVREDEQARVGRWLESLPRPVGVMAPNDIRGIDVLNACQTQGLRVPDDVAVIGVDDDELLCEICSPPLSSIVPNIEQIGYEAAALLDRLMDGEPVGFEERFVSPSGVTTRLSTDVLSIGDPEFAAAVRFIRQNACLGITVGDVLDHVPISRSTLERNFRGLLRRSPQAEIRAVQLARARQLLAETDHPIHRIADLVGYQHVEYFNVVFKREIGQTPGQYRRRVRAHNGRGPRARGDGSGVGEPATEIAGAGRAAFD
jgi:LacI family transcriptional regulator